MLAMLADEEIIYKGKKRPTQIDVGMDPILFFHVYYSYGD
jgi:hypothetical protein